MSPPGARRGWGEISAHHALVLAAAGALVVPDGQAAAFDAALTLTEADRWPFEHARLQLAYGVWLRRHQDKSEARAPPRCAVETFRRLGAEPWADRATEEPRASGEVLGPRPAAPVPTTANSTAPCGRSSSPPCRWTRSGRTAVGSRRAGAGGCRSPAPSPVNPRCSCWTNRQPTRRAHGRAAADLPAGRPRRDRPGDRAAGSGR